MVIHLSSYPSDNLAICVSAGGVKTQVAARMSIVSDVLE